MKESDFKLGIWLVRTRRPENMPIGTVVKVISGSSRNMIVEDKNGRKYTGSYSYEFFRLAEYHEIPGDVINSYSIY